MNSLANYINKLFKYFFTFYSIASFSSRKTYDTKFYHPANFELKQIKTAKVVPWRPFYASDSPNTFSSNLPKKLKKQQHSP